MIKLKNCPFCGREEPLWYEFQGSFFVNCPRCNCRGPSSVLKEKAFKSWNRRARVKPKTLVLQARKKTESKHDVEIGPCKCGAWHRPRKGVRR